MSFVRRPVFSEVRDGEGIRVFTDVENGREKVVVHTFRTDTEDIKASNAAIRAANGYGKTSVWNGREYVLVARVETKWLYDLAKQGIKFWEPEGWKVIKGLLNSNEYEDFRTAPGRI